MDKSKIPTKLVNISGRDVEIYEWITQDEEDQLQSILAGDNQVEISGQGVETSLKVPITKVAEYNKKLVEVYCVNLSWEEYNVMSPTHRDEVQDAIGSILQKKKVSK